MERDSSTYPKTNTSTFPRLRVQNVPPVHTLYNTISAPHRTPRVPSHPLGRDDGERVRLAVARAREHGLLRGPAGRRVARERSRAAEREEQAAARRDGGERRRGHAAAARERAARDAAGALGGLHREAARRAREGVRRERLHGPGAACEQAAGRARSDRALGGETARALCYTV